VDFDNQLKLLDDIVECYRAKRKAHTRKQWFTPRAVWARLHGKDAVFDSLRNSDLKFSQRAHGILRSHLASAELSKREIGEMTLYLKNHRSFIAERDFFLVVYALIIGVLLLMPRTDFSSWVIVGFSILFGLMAALERWHMKLNDSVYSEIFEFLQYEAKEG
jgi:hypothetical protein